MRSRHSVGRLASRATKRRDRRPWKAGEDQPHPIDGRRSDPNVSALRAYAFSVVDGKLASTVWSRPR